MSAFKFLTHLFLPSAHNNQRAKIIHSGSLLYLAVFVMGFQLVLNLIPKALPSVLGYAANISASEVISLTNKERSALGLAPLTENKSLDAAALAKGQDMLSKGYWAHFAPDGTSPWSFFTNFGYKYQYAGENLARDFNNAGSAVEAWMNSATHKENILNPHYKEIGIGVVEGSLSGVDTTIIVQFFGASTTSVPQIAVARAETNTSEESSPSPAPLKPSPVPTPVAEATPYLVAQAVPSIEPTTISEIPSSVNLTAKISPFQSTKNLSVGTLGVILLVLSIDLIIIKQKRISRIGGRTLAHIAYLSMILAVLLILKAGQII